MIVFFMRANPRFANKKAIFDSKIVAVATGLGAQNCKGVNLKASQELFQP
jgi:hypothetical protein